MLILLAAAALFNIDAAVGALPVTVNPDERGHRSAINASPRLLFVLLLKSFS